MMKQMETTSRTVNTVGTVQLSLVPSAHGDCVFASTQMSTRLNLKGPERPQLNLVGPARPRFVGAPVATSARFFVRGARKAPTCDAPTATSARFSCPEDREVLVIGDAAQAPVESEQVLA